MVEKLATEFNPPNPPAVKLPEPTKHHEKAVSQGKTPAEYVHDAMKLHQAQYQGSPPPALLKWIGDGQLAVLPKNRMLCAIGLTSGLMLAGSTAKIATGKGLDGSVPDIKKIPTFLQGLHEMKFTEKWDGGKIHQMMKDYHPTKTNTASRWLKYAQWATYSAGGFAGILMGTDFAYSNVKKKLSDPHYIEDFLPRVAMHQGNTFSWLAAATGIFGSASGLWMLPVPGLNYALGLAGRTTSMQDRNFMIGGLNDIMSGSTTTSYLRLREGMNYMCHYAVTNPAETPTQFEFLAYALLGPLFKKQLTNEQIDKFTDAVHAVRDHYWQEGGIPKSKRKEALAAMRTAFTGEGLEVLLINLGLNPANIEFTKINGLTGKIGDIGEGKEIRKEQKGYDQAITERLGKYVEHGLISQERADWVKEGIELRKQGKIQKALSPVESPQAEPTKEEPLAQSTDVKDFGHRYAVDTDAQQPPQAEADKQQEETQFAKDSLKQQPAAVAAAGSFKERVAQGKSATYEHSV